MTTAIVIATARRLVASQRTAASWQNSTANGTRKKPMFSIAFETSSL